jgi:hypothetical protein
VAESGSEPRGEGGGRRGVILEKVKKKMRGGKGRRGKEKQEGGLREREAESLDKDEPRDGGNKIESTTDSELSNW